MGDILVSESTEGKFGNIYNRTIQADIENRRENSFQKITVDVMFLSRHNGTLKYKMRYKKMVSGQMLSAY